MSGRVFEHNITIDRGSQFNFKFKKLDNGVDNFDFTGFAARMQIRENYNSPDYILSLISPNNITIDIPNATVRVEILPSQTLLFDNTEKIYYYDIEIYKPLEAENIIKIMRGQAKLIPEVTI